MKVSVIRELRRYVLQEKLASLLKSLFSMRSQAMTEKVENVRAIKNIKNDIARVKTIIRENELKSQ